MNKETLAAQLNGLYYPIRLTKETTKLAADNRLVIVYGASDDLMEFEGAITEELGIGEAFIGKDGKLLPEHAASACCKFCGYREAVKDATVIESLWCDGDGPAWTFKTTIPHATFDVMEDGEVFCRGIVFSLNEVTKPA